MGNEEFKQKEVEREKELELRELNLETKRKEDDVENSLKTEKGLESKEKKLEKVKTTIYEMEKEKESCVLGKEILKS